MTRFNVPGVLSLYLAWMGLTCAALLAGIGGMLPFGIGSLGPDAAFLGLIEAELFFVTVVWPFFMPKLILPQAAAATKIVGPGGEPHLLILQVGVMLGVAMPLALVSRNLSQIGTGEFFKAQLLVGAIACFVTALLDRPEARRVRTWYFLGFFALSALAPFVAFLAGEMGAGGGAGFLAAVSPFWAAAQFRSEAALSWAPGAQAAIFGVAALVLLSMGAFRQPVDSAPTST
ncbi:MAG TPA: hypothetical protein VFT32_12110 [Candidatus Eisenbacteria bacterium]|nr:hypothetical protein [Candidatus Eisenbacteria bacterium]